MLVMLVVLVLTQTPRSNAPPITLTSVAANTTTYDALFRLPPSVAAGEYTAEIFSGLRTPSTKQGWVPLSMFLSPQQPQLTTVSVKPAKVWPSKVFTVRNTHLLWSSVNPALPSPLS